MAVREVSDIRITDPYIKQLIAEEQELRNDGTATKTAMGLIRERFAQLEMTRGRAPRRREKVSA